VNIEFEPKNRDIFIINKTRRATQRDTLLEIRYVTKDMMILEMIMARSPSKVLKLIREEDVVNWMKPIVQILNS
jgi:hypothetical protein